MNLQIFVTLLVTGVIVGFIATFSNKSRSANPALNLVVTSVGAFLGWFVLRQIGGTAIMIGFAIGGGVLLLWLLRFFRK